MLMNQEKLKDLPVNYLLLFIIKSLMFQQGKIRLDEGRRDE